MVTLEEAYEKVFTKYYPGQKSFEALEDKTHYIFFPRPSDTPDDETYDTGVVFPAVNKKTGAVESFNMVTDNLENPVIHPIKIK